MIVSLMVPDCNQGEVNTVRRFFTGVRYVYVTDAPDALSLSGCDVQENTYAILSSGDPTAGKQLVDAWLLDQREIVIIDKRLPMAQSAIAYMKANYPTVTIYNRQFQRI